MTVRAAGGARTATGWLTRLFSDNGHIVVTGGGGASILGGSPGGLAG